LRWCLVSDLLPVRATAGPAGGSATGAAPGSTAQSPPVIPARTSALAAVKRPVPVLCYGRVPAVRQPTRYPVRAAAE